MKHPAPVARAIILGNIGVAFVDVLLAINRPGADSWLRQLLSLSPANLLDGAWWEPLTYMWLHAPPVGFWVTHILFNMLTLSISAVRWSRVWDRRVSRSFIWWVA